VFKAPGVADHSCGLNLHEFNDTLPIGSVVQCTKCGRYWKRGRKWWRWEAKFETRRRQRATYRRDRRAGFPSNTCSPGS
jgi:hypothetical protein